MSLHSEHSPSSMKRVMGCPGSKRLEMGCPDISSPQSILGSTIHNAIPIAHDAGVKFEALVGTLIQVGDRQEVFTSEMAPHAQTYMDALQHYKRDGHLMIERRVDFSGTIEAEDAWGTSDAVVLLSDEYQIHDLKYGMGVKIDAFRNVQLMLYALGVLEEFGTLGIKRVVLVIHQPRLQHVSEWVVSLEELYEFAQRVRIAIGIAARDDAPLIPGEDQCRFCKAKSICPALEKLALQEFDDLNDPRHADNTRLGSARVKVELIRAWCDAVVDETERRMDKGERVPGMKYVLGKKGPRKWSDVAMATQLLKGMRLRDSEIYDSALISPATAEKLFKTETIGPRQWASLQPLIEQSEARPTAVVATDPRPEYDPTPTLDLFEVIDQQPQDQEA